MRAEGGGREPDCGRQLGPGREEEGGRGRRRDSHKQLSPLVVCASTVACVVVLQVYTTTSHKHYTTHHTTTQTLCTLHICTYVKPTYVFEHFIETGDIFMM